MTTATLRDLLARTQAATGSDHRLNLELAAALLGGEITPHLNMAAGCVVDAVVCPSPLGSKESKWLQEARDWTGSIDAAVALIGRMLPGAVWHVMTDYGDLNRAKIGPTGRPSASVYRVQDQPEFQVEDAETPALALCAALLAAMVAREEQQQRVEVPSDLPAGDAEPLP